MLIRSLIGLLVIGIAELFPNFGPILSFIGASTVTMMSFILPAIFYLKLQENHLIPFHQRVFHFEIVVVAVMFGGAGIYASVQGFKNPLTTWYLFNNGDTRFPKKIIIIIIKKWKWRFESFINVHTSASWFNADFIFFVTSWKKAKNVARKKKPHGFNPWLIFSSNIRQRGFCLWKKKFLFAKVRFSFGKVKFSFWII